MKTTHSHTRRHPHLSRWQQSTAWILQIAATIIFLTAGNSKIIGTEKAIEVFSHFSSSPELRYLIGGFEIVCAMQLLFPDRAFIGSMMLAALMGGAILAHLAIIEGGPIPAFVLLCISVTIAWFRRPTDMMKS
ncbi:DoxX family protein [Vacuolonema iberomarrocanum]|uniref:DoxX family protein n=1 Tax=Vacuolonema iberomarrocanum TaxID=3454632 RepID=UPI0019EA92DD|nr:DoxX family protein [filamentous cyanobacterium LEGE 07170]